MSLTLQRGLEQIWNVQDTTLISSDPDTNFGGSTTLLGGPGRTILIRFGDISRLVPAGKRVASASLVFEQQAGSPPNLQSVSTVRLPWNEGPRHTFSASFTMPDPKAKPKPPMGSATWRERQGQIAGWDRPGGWGPKDARPIESANLEIRDASVSITGLGEAVQAMATDPESNYGFSLRFSANLEFASSESAKNRPRLEIMLADAAPVERKVDLALTGFSATDSVAKATVFNAGTGAVTGYSVIFRTEEGEISVAAPGPLAPGATAVIEHAVKPDPARPVRLQPVLARVSAAGDADPRNDAFTGYVGAKTINCSLEDARRFNETYLGESRFSFAPSGADARVNFQQVEGGPDGTEAMMAVYRQLFGNSLEQFSKAGGGYPGFVGLSGWGDTRFDGVVPGQIPLPLVPISSPVFDVNPLVPSGLLNMTEVAYLNRDAAKPWPTVPKTVILRVQDQLGRSLAGTQVSLTSRTGADAPATTDITVPATGSVILPKFPATADEVKLSLSLNGETEAAPFYVWQLVDQASRGNRDVAFLELRANLPAAKIDHATDLAENKVVTDSVNTPPAKLIVLTQRGGSSDGVALPAGKGAWIEIDLGRDRTIAEVSLDFAGDQMWKSFDIVGYGTGQPASEAGAFAQEMDARNHMAPVAYRGSAPRIRYLRIINRSEGAGRLRTLQVRPAIL